MDTERAPGNNWYNPQMCPRPTGSLPPLMESYQATRLPGPDAMLAQYQRIAGALAPHADVLLCETLATVAEGVAATTAAAATGRPVWVSWTLEDSLRGRLRSGEPLEVSGQVLGCWQGCLVTDVTLQRRRRGDSLA